MIENISLQNFRRFEKFSLRMRSGNILVGPNNAGKSSILDAIRLLAACLRASRKRSPELIQMEAGHVVSGYHVSEDVLPFRLANITKNYDESDAQAVFTTSNKTRITLRLHHSKPTLFYLQTDKGDIPRTSSHFRKLIDVEPIIIPTLSPLEIEEKWVEDTTVNRNASTRLASRVLRNFWLRATNADFDAFKHDVEAAWPTIKIQKPRMEGRFVVMMYEENRVPREVQWAGLGFQAWLQIQTHLRRGGDDAILVIDEPDIYLHPDLQRRLLIDIRQRYKQFVMATHAVEIINEAETAEVVSINSEFRSGKRINSEEDYDAVCRYLGSTDNADVARITRAKKILFVEGGDARLLRRMATRFGLANLADPQKTAVVRLGGFSEWRRAQHALWAFKEVFDLNIRGFSVFDRDFKCDDEIAHHIGTLSSQNLECSVLSVKEIENALLSVPALQRAALKRLKAKSGKDALIATSDVDAMLTSVTDGLESHVFSRRLASFMEYKKGGAWADTTLVETQTTAFKIAWSTLAGRLRIVPGKGALARFNELLQKRFGISISEASIVESMQREELPTEMYSLLINLDEFCDDNQEARS